MRKRGVKKNRKCALAFLLAVLLWAEGTLGSVYAAQETVSENTPVITPIETEQPAEGEVSAPEGTEQPAEEETPIPGEADKPEGEETEQPAEGEKPEPSETEKPVEEETPASDESVSENTSDEETDESVSENTAESEEELLPERIPGAGEALGEPPLLSEEGGSEAALFRDGSVMSTRAGSISLQKPGTVDIIARYKAYPWNLNVSNTYSDKPSTKSPYRAGHLSSESLENALNLMNFIRYVAGIPAEVTLNEEYIELVQAGALVNCVNDKLSHTPTQPSGFPDDLYEKGKAGCSSSNIAWNYGNMAQSLLNGWMYDGDASNISVMGHRRWVLNPSMTQTGFGAVGAYSAMYAFDGKGSKITDYVAWPAQNMPIELMNGSGTPWTLSPGSDYKTVEQGQVTVTLKNVSSGKTWTFSDAKKDGYFAVNKGGYGMPNCIIFRPNNVSYDKSSQFQVTVTGLKDQEGNAATLSYRVDFFSLSDPPKEVEKVALDTENLHLLLDDTEGKNQGALHATLTPSNAADKTLTWNSLNPAVATVDANGVVTAKGVGETTITATAVNGKQAACGVKVSKYTLSADGIVFDEKENSYKLEFELREDDPQGSTKKITVKDGEADTTDKVRWSSENENVVTVDADGVVTPTGIGEAAIWADVADGLKMFGCEVTVESAALPSMQMRESTLTMKAGESRQLRVYLSPADTKWGSNGKKYIKWKSDRAGTVAFEVRQDAGLAEASGGSTVTTTVSETISGNTVTVKALAAGKAKITAEIVDETGQTVGTVGEEKGKAACEVTVQESAVLPAEAACPRGIALINTHNTLKDVALPEGWSWKYPDTSLAQFAGRREKTFPAEYQPPAAKDVQPAETFLTVYFLSLEKLSVCVKHSDNAGVGQEVTVLKSGWTAHCYVNYSFEEALEQYEEKNDALKNNTWYQKQKKELLENLDKNIVLTSSKPQSITVEAVKNTEGKTAVSAKAPGDAVLNAELKLGKKTFRAGQKLTVAEQVEAAFRVTGLDCFAKVGGEDSYRYAAELGDFPMSAKGGINSKIRLEMAGVTKLTVKSGNSKVVSVKASAVKPIDSNKYEIPLAVSAAGTAEITVTGNNAAKTSRTLTLVVTDARPGLGEETVTVNTLQTGGTGFYLYAAKDAEGVPYNITGVTLSDDKSGQNSTKFTLTSGNAADGSTRDCRITAKSDTKTGTYKMKLQAAAGGKSYDLPFTVKVVSVKPKCSVKQKSRLNLFYSDTSSLLSIDTEEQVKGVSLTGCGYFVEQSAQKDGYYLKPGSGATLNSVKKGTLKLQLEGWKPLEMPFTVSVEKKAIKISPVTKTVTLYPKSSINTARIGIKNADALSWDRLAIGVVSGKAKGNFEAVLQKEEQAILLQGKNLNQTESFRMTIPLRAENWTEAVNLTCSVKVNLKNPSIVSEKRTLQLNANEAYMGWDADVTAIRWKNGGDVLTSQDVRVSVYCDPKDAKAKALVADSGVVFTVNRENGAYQVRVRLNNKSVKVGSYKYIVQVSGKKDGKIWKTPLTVKVVNTKPDKAIKIAAKGSIDVLNREGSFMTLTPSLKAVNGTFAIPDNREVKLTGHDAHLFRARWNDDGKTIELRAKENVTLVIKYNYAVTPIVSIQNVNGETEEIRTASVKFKLKQGSVKVSAAPKTTLMYSNAYNAAAIDMKGALKGAAAPEIENVTLVGNTDAFTYVYNKDGKGTLTMKRTGCAVKGKRYSLRFRVTFAEQADNVKPVTVKYAVTVK